MTESSPRAEAAPAPLRDAAAAPLRGVGAAPLRGVGAAPLRGDDHTFPAPVFRDTVLEPLFEGAKAHFVDAFRRVDRAHCVMLAEAGLLAPDAARAIARALAAIERELDLPATRYTGEVEDLFFLVERELARRLGPDLAGRLHTGRSRNDIDHTLFRIVLKGHLDRLSGQARGLLAALLDKARAEAATPVLAYTHGQPAQVTTFGHYLAAMAEVLIGDLERLAAARRVVDLCPMGAAAITTTGFPLDRARMAHLLGFADFRLNSYACIAAVDYVTAPYAAVKLAMLHLGRLMQDFQFWTAFEVGQLHLPDGFVQVSSIMPQKRNPVPIEHARLLASLAAGRAEAALSVMHNTPFTDMNDSEGEVQAASHRALLDAGRAFDLAAALVRAARVEGARVADNIARSGATVTELADTLVREEGLPFRLAHAVAAQTAAAARAAGAPLAAAHDAFRTAFAAAVGHAPALDAPRLAQVVSPEHFIAVRARPGGPAAAPMAEALDRYDAALRAGEAEAAALAAREAAQAADLDRAFAALLD